MGEWRCYAIRLFASSLIKWIYCKLRSKALPVRVDNFKNEFLTASNHLDNSMELWVSGSLSVTVSSLGIIPSNLDKSAISAVISVLSALFLGLQSSV